MKMKIYGVKHSKGEVEGNSFDFTKFFAMAKMERKDTQSGGAGIDLRGLPELSNLIHKYDFWNNGNGLECEIVIEPMAMGGGNIRETVTSCTPVQPVKK